VNRFPVVLVTRRLVPGVFELLEPACDVRVHDGESPMPREALLAGSHAIVCTFADVIDAPLLGGIVDEQALITALDEGHLFAAALDGYEHEPEVPERLRTHERVVLAPHLGSATEATRRAMGELAVRNVLAVLAGNPPLTPVAPSGPAG
jgi:D-isomer specific 2-hydroxyacid dehydrogenase, NAD binding domain